VHTTRFLNNHHQVRSKHKTVFYLGVVPLDLPKKYLFTLVGNGGIRTLWGNSSMLCNTSCKTKRGQVRNRTWLPLMVRDLVYQFQMMYLRGTLSVPEESCSRNISCTLNLISMFLLLSGNQMRECCAIHLAKRRNLFSHLLSVLCFERTWWWLFKKRVVCTKFDIYVFYQYVDNRELEIQFVAFATSIHVSSSVTLVTTMENG
jgi:hypothetical protein